MTKLEKIERELANLWDRQIERDSKSGKLDKLFAEAEAEIASGKVRPL